MASIKVEEELDESKARKSAGMNIKIVQPPSLTTNQSVIYLPVIDAKIVPLSSGDEVTEDNENEPLEEDGAASDIDSSSSVCPISALSETDLDESWESMDREVLVNRIAKSVSRDKVHIETAPSTPSTNHPEFVDVRARYSTPPGEPSDEENCLETPMPPKSAHPRRNPSPLPRLTRSPSKPCITISPPSDAATPVKKAHAKSPYFSPAGSAKKPPRSPGGVLSCIPFPPLSSPQFGLLQEKLCHDPLRLLIGVTFLIRTYGKSSIPIFYKLIELFPTATDLANADKDVIVELTRHLGLQSVRADTYIRYAKTFIENPPVKEKRYRVENYPTKNAHADIKKREVLSDKDLRGGAWEIGHLTKGPYAIDSWRIFCRDVLRGLAKGWNGEGATEPDFQPEWMRVLPKDKELRAFLRWCWLREGWVWDADTGEISVPTKELVDAVNEGRVVWEWKGKDGKGDWRILGKYEGKEAKEEIDMKRDLE